MSAKPHIILAAEEGTSLSSGSLQLYASLDTSITPQAGDPIIGAVELYNYDPLNRRAAVGIMVATEYRRQGYALAMLQELHHMFSRPAGDIPEIQATNQHDNPQDVQELAKREPRLHCLYADIAECNSASISLFRKAGYNECGHFKEWLNVDGRYLDTIRMQKLL